MPGLCGDSSSKTQQEANLEQTFCHVLLAPAMMRSPNIAVLPSVLAPSTRGRESGLSPSSNPIHGPVPGTDRWEGSCPCPDSGPIPGGGFGEQSSVSNASPDSDATYALISGGWGRFTRPSPHPGPIPGGERGERSVSGPSPGPQSHPYPHLRRRERGGPALP